MDGKMSLSQKRREEGKCCYCGGERDGEYKMCSECRAYHRSWYRVMRDRQTKKQRFQFNVKKASYMNARNKRLRARDFASGVSSRARSIGCVMHAAPNAGNRTDSGG